jgi:uncharacterized protein YbaP (TraB family)
MFVLLFVVLLPGCASRGGALARLDELGPREAMPLFWRVESPRGATLYLLGSVHVGPPEGWLYPPAIEAAFEGSSALVVEVDPDGIDEETQTLLLARYGMLPPGERLEDRLEPATRAALERHVARSDLPKAMIDHMQPWLASNLLVLDATRQAGWSARGGVDVGFVARAGERSIVPLESVEYQMAIFAALPPALQDMLLRDTLGRFDDLGDYVQRMIDVWRTGDESALEGFVFESAREDPAFEPFFEAVILQRNRDMARRLRVLLDAEQHRGESVFVVVGAAHLVGRESIRTLLDGWGYPSVRLDRSALERRPLPGGDRAVHP